MNDNREIRTFRLIEFRADGPEDQAPQITGNAAVYNSPSVDLGGFIEVIEPGFFEGVLSGDTRALFNHDANYVLGRTTSGTLRLVDHDAGLGFQVEPPDTGMIRDLVLAPMKRGDIDQCSFAFTVKPGGDEWNERPDGLWQRTLKRGGCQELFDISVVTYPAYPETSAQTRARFNEIATGPAGLRKNTAIEEPGPVAPDSIDNPEAAETPAGDGLRMYKHEILKLKVKP